MFDKKLSQRKAITKEASHKEYCIIIFLITHSMLNEKIMEKKKIDISMRYGNKEHEEESGAHRDN
jgi:hypothetical protein